MKKTNLISLIVFVVALVWVFTLKNDTIRAVQAKVLGAFGVVRNSAAAVAFRDDVINDEPIDPATVAERYDQGELSERYSQLLKELFRLRALESNIDMLLEENVELKHSLNFVELNKEKGHTLIAARVTNRRSGSWWRTLTIDKGSADGIVENSSVQTPVAIDRTGAVEGALVGKVTVVGKHQSTVVLVTDEECRVAAYVHGVFAQQESTKEVQRVKGILSGAPGAGTSVPHLVLGNLPKEADRFGVTTGKKVYSTGIPSPGPDPVPQGVFPSGLLLGYIKEFEVKEIDAEAKVTPAIEFNTLSHVFVRAPIKRTEDDAGDTSEGAPGDTPGDTPRAAPVPVAVPATGGTAPAPAPLRDVPRASRVIDEID